MLLQILSHHQGPCTRSLRPISESFDNQRIESLRLVNDFLKVQGDGSGV